MKLIKADLLSDVVDTYAQTKTTIQGRIYSKTVNSVTVLGPSLNRFVDVVADSTALNIPNLSYLSPNGRLFTLSAITTGIAFISLYDINMSTGAKTFVGNIRASFPNSAATTHTLRGLKIIDTGVTGWKIFIASSGSVTINGGVFLLNKIDKADFIAVGSTLISFATSNDQKGVYFLQDSANIGTGQLNIASTGLTLDITNSKLYCHNGVSATHQFYVYDTAIAPTYTTASVSVSVASPGVVTDTGHTFLVNTPVVFTAGTLPTGLTVGTVYFVRNPVAGISYELSATSGGASINTTGSPSVGAVIGRAFGTTGSNFVLKTGNLPALTGTLIQQDSEDYAVPGHTANSGFPCVFFCTSSNLYLGKLSELTSGTTTWTSLVTSNLLGSANQITAPTLTLATWSNVLDRAVYLTNANILVMKQVVNNSIDKLFGRASNIYRETFAASDTQGLGFLTATSLDVEDGWIVATGSTIGQRGCIISDLRSDASFDYSYIVTKVLNTPSATYKLLSIYKQLDGDSGSIQAFYRTSGFGSITGGWTSIAVDADISAVASAAQIQFKLRFNTLALGGSIPAQINELLLGYETLSEISDYWEFSDDFSDNNVPSRSAFRLKTAYTTSVPTLYYRAYDLSDALLINNNTVTNSTKFEYSTDNGNTWIPLGTIPNVVGTLVRYSFTSPPGVDIRPSIRES